VAGSIAALAVLGWIFGVSFRTALIAGMALSLSSTALALQPITERGGLATQSGQSSFAVLLFQDLAVIPMLAVLPFLGSNARVELEWHRALWPAVAITATLVGGHYLVRPVFRHIARTRLREIFTAFALLLVLGIALVYALTGLSMALGAFLAGVILAESEYRHEIEAAVEPFKGLLLGLFFISVGMAVDFTVARAHPFIVLGVLLGFLAAKGAILWLIGRRAGLPAAELPLFVLLLAPGSEFAFVVLGPGAAGGMLPEPMIQALVLAVALSMLATPFVLAAHDRLLAPRLASQAKQAAADTPQAGTVIIAGLGRVGQVVARMLNGSGYHPTVLDDDPDHVEQSRKYGFRVFYGDATRLDLLHAAGADRAELLIATLDDVEGTTRLARTAKKHFPKLRIIARAHDMRHMFELRDLGVEVIERETWFAAVKLGEAALAAVSGDAGRAQRAAQAFAEHDREVVAKLYEVHRSEPEAALSVSNELRDQFARTLKADEAALQENQNPTA
jgi:glutathione-regulated potassium-efflux system ancillary protein KefC